MAVSDPDGASVPGPGQPVPFTAVLHPPAGDPDPVGSVVFTLARQGSGQQSTVCTADVTADRATCSVAFPTGGATYDVAAYFEPGSGVGGAQTYVPSQAALQVTVGP